MANSQQYNEVTQGNLDDEPPKNESLAYPGRRFLALLIDFALLILVSFILTQLAVAFGLQINWWGRFIGLLVCVLYFGVCGSRICRGQSLGKKICGIKVIQIDGTYLTLRKSLARALILTTPLMLNNVQFPGMSIDSLWLYPLGLIVFGGFINFMYLFFFNRVNRQSLHDLALNTVVVNSSSNLATVPQFPKIHKVIVSSVFALTFFSPLAGRLLIESPQLSAMLALQQQIVQTTGISQVNVMEQTIYSRLHPDSEPKYALAITMQSSESPQAQTKSIAQFALMHYPKAKDLDSLQITLVHGVDLGLWSEWSSTTQQFAIKDGELVTTPEQKH